MSGELPVPRITGSMGRGRVVWAGSGGRVMMWGAVYGGGILYVYLGASLRQADRVFRGPEGPANPETRRT